MTGPVVDGSSSLTPPLMRWPKVENPFRHSGSLKQLTLDGVGFRAMSMTQKPVACDEPHGNSAFPKRETPASITPLTTVKVLTVMNRPVVGTSIGSIVGDVEIRFERKRGDGDLGCRSRGVVVQALDHSGDRARNGARGWPF